VCRGFCEAAKIEAPLLTGPTGEFGFDVTIDSTPVSIWRVQFEAKDAGHVCIDFGLPDRAEDAATWRALMDANFTLISLSAQSFCRDPETGHVVLQFEFPMEGADGAELFDACRQLVSMAAQWRRGELSIASPRASTSPVERPAAPSAAFA
jgi:hypothetical protein